MLNPDQNDRHVYPSVYFGQTLCALALTSGDAGQDQICTQPSPSQRKLSDVQLCYSNLLANEIRGFVRAGLNL